MPELEDSPHDAIVAELDEKFDGGVVPRGAVTAQRPAWRASERGATAGEKRPEAEKEPSLTVLPGSVEAVRGSRGFFALFLFDPGIR